MNAGEAKPMTAMPVITQCCNQANPKLHTILRVHPFVTEWQRSQAARQLDCQEPDDLNDCQPEKAALERWPCIHR
jgi:hypothetical protein